MKGEKILASEKLSDEDLENVVGGSAEELADDSRFLNVLLGGVPGLQFNIFQKLKMRGTKSA